MKRKMDFTRIFASLSSMILPEGFVSCLNSPSLFFLFTFFYFPPLSRLPVQAVHKIVTIVNSFEVCKSKKCINYTSICTVLLRRIRIPAAGLFKSFVSYISLSVYIQQLENRIKNCREIRWWELYQKLSCFLNFFIYRIIWTAPLQEYLHAVLLAWPFAHPCTLCTCIFCHVVYQQRNLENTVRRWASEMPCHTMLCSGQSCSVVLVTELQLRALGTTLRL